jgi:hypothetical protein
MLVILGCVGVIFYAVTDSSMLLKDRLPIITSAVTGFGFAVATLGGFLTLLVAVAPRWLSEIGLGPRLSFDWQCNNGGYNHKWDRILRVDGSTPTMVRSPAIIVRIAIKNEGLIAAELVQVKLEGIWRFDGGNPKPLPHAKFSPLRWADSYDLDEFENLKHHRCGNVIEPLIHAGAKQFFDFCFIFEPGSPFYEQSKSDPQYWCVHPFYQWLPALEENAVLEPGATYAVTLAVSARNSHVEKKTFHVKCENQGALTKKLMANGDVVGDKNSTCPIKIDLSPEVLLVNNE